MHKGNVEDWSALACYCAHCDHLIAILPLLNMPSNFAGSSCKEYALNERGKEFCFKFINPLTDRIDHIQTLRKVAKLGYKCVQSLVVQSFVIAVRRCLLTKNTLKASQSITNKH